ncbi:MAG: hypothetical protein FJ042_01760 [Candidatus Cloacimonetes bacterium]|nr:hypothetical protein [Candidatus Cloacimonadota bacterium]
MKKLIKLLLKAGIVAGTVVFTVKQVKSMKIAKKLERELPAFLSAKYGEEPVLTICKALFKIFVKVEFSQDIHDKHRDIENEIREYAQSICPGCDKNLMIKVTAKESDEVEG